MAKAKKKANKKVAKVKTATKESKEFRAALEVLGIPLTFAGDFLDLSERQPIRYAQADTPVPGPVRKLLKLVLQKKVTAEQLRAL